LDPRIKGLAIEIGPLAAGWAKVQEIRRYLDLFRKSGKFTVVYMKQGGEKEYYLASACEEIYCPPSASLSLRGFAVTGGWVISFEPAGQSSACLRMCFIPLIHQALSFEVS
jgi:protease-4